MSYVIEQSFARVGLIIVSWCSFYITLIGDKHWSVKL